MSRMGGSWRRGRSLCWRRRIGKRRRRRCLRLLPDLHHSLLPVGSFPIFWHQGSIPLDGGHLTLLLENINKLKLLLLLNYILSMILINTVLICPHPQSILEIMQMLEDVSGWMSRGLLHHHYHWCIVQPSSWTPSPHSTSSIQSNLDPDNNM